MEVDWKTNKEKPSSLDSNPNLSISSSPKYYESDAIDHSSTETGSRGRAGSSPTSAEEKTPHISPRTTHGTVTSFFRTLQ
uniref:(California timema) hypothetical protein n=1 Tax=Timema californicum TaxID=61474 RepID=A0A7R9JLB1_TIMCA|nr:unnamed protein product [Timema californicum]